jgi:NTP pyrophosphatase (non-canonical NTP hydrolase)
MFSDLPWAEMRAEASRALRTWAPPRSGLPKLQEECGEVIAAVNQYSYGRLTAEGLAEELADNLLMLVQAAQIVGEAVLRNAVMAKLARLTQRLDDTWRSPQLSHPGAANVDVEVAQRVRALVGHGREPTDEFLEELFRDFRPELDVKEWRRRLYHRAVGHYLEQRP